MTEPTILVNFDIAPDSATFVAPSIDGIRGGRWKDRFRAKKQLQQKQKRTNRTYRPSRNGSGEQHQLETDIERSYEGGTKEQERNKEKVETKRKRGNRLSAGGNAENIASKQRGDRPVISSIFSSNPEPGAKPILSNPKDAVSTEPTNAPLNDGSAFAGMGLMPTLASHLANKLNLKAPTSIQQTAIPQLISTDSDAFIQAETGSGKTLTYLLPVVQRILVASSDGNKLHRDSGCFAIILAPTRELGRQIHSVLLQLLSHPSLHWLVPILILGGEKKKSEKARIRKGGNILVATPGRLADHLVNTTSLNVGSVRWLVLDEGDRLMELGFEETLQQILSALNSKQQAQFGTVLSQRSLALPERRITILCSATMKTSVQRLGNMSLQDALYLKSEKVDEKGESHNRDDNDDFQAPAQLKQAYIIAPAKLRLVSLMSILRRAFIRKKENMKIIVFFSCADSVDFHYEVFGRAEEDSGSEEKQDFIPDNSPIWQEDESRKVSSDISKSTAAKHPNHVARSKAPLIDASISLFKLHGSLSQQIRTATLNGFFHEKGGSVLFCTDVASRGLDLPNVDLVIQYDPPFSRDDYIHRIGRTARAGRDGRAMIFLLPGCEEGYPNKVLKDHNLTRTLANEVLMKGFGNAPSSDKQKPKNTDQVWKKDFMPKTSGEKWEKEAIEFHLGVERWVLSSSERDGLAKKAFQSHVRAYATHVAAEREVFDIKQLHLGHLAKSFGLRERPSNISVPGRAKTNGGTQMELGTKRKMSAFDKDENAESTAAELEEVSRRMRKKMREHMNVASEFNIG